MTSSGKVWSGELIMTTALIWPFLLGTIFIPSEVKAQEPWSFEPAERGSLWLDLGSDFGKDRPIAGMFSESAAMQKALSSQVRVSGSERPELIFEWELLTALITSAFLHSGADRFQRAMSANPAFLQMLSDSGLESPRVLWRRLEFLLAPAIEEYVRAENSVMEEARELEALGFDSPAYEDAVRARAREPLAFVDWVLQKAQSREASLAKQAESAQGLEERHRLRALALCYARAKGMQQAEAEFGDRFGEFLYGAIAPTLNTAFPRATFAESIRKSVFLDQGCRQ